MTIGRPLRRVRRGAHTERREWTPEEVLSCYLASVAPDWLGAEPAGLGPDGEALGFLDRYSLSSDEALSEELWELIDNYGENSDEVQQFHLDNPWDKRFDVLHQGPYPG